MSFRITLRDALTVFETITSLPKLPAECIRTSYNIAKIKMTIAPEIDLFKESQNFLIKSLGSFNEKDNTYTIVANQLPEYEKSLKKLLDTEVEIGLEKIKMEDMIGSKPEKYPDITPEQFFKLAPIMEN